MTRVTDYQFSIPQPLAAMLEGEARASDRTVEAHLLHVLERRYANLIRICRCGFYVYAVTDDLRCAWCQEPCCPWDAIPHDHRDMCFACAKKQGIDTTGKGGFRAAPEGKV